MRRWQSESLNAMARKNIKSPAFTRQRGPSLQQIHAGIMGARKEALVKSLVAAAAEGRLGEVKTLVMAGADVNGVFEYTALYRACALRQWHVARFLIEQGANNNWRHANSGTAFDIAMNKVTSDRAQASEVLLCMVKSGVELNAIMNNGLSPVMNALAHGDAELAKAMHERGAKLDLPSYMSEKSLLSVMRFCAPAHQYAALEFLIDRGVDLRERNAKGQTALDIAKTNGKSSQDVIDLLIDAPRRAQQIVVDAALKGQPTGVRRKFKPK